MVLIRILKPALFIYECTRTFVLVCIFASLFYGTDAVSCLAFAAPGAIFPIMALFIWIDTTGFKVYIPLYTAGKCIGLFSLAIWFAVSWVGMIRDGFPFFNKAGEILFLLGDLLALAAILIILRNMRKSLNKQETITEEKQCE
jgi:hypothetical protein